MTVQDRNDEEYEALDLELLNLSRIAAEGRISRLDRAIGQHRSCLIDHDEHLLSVLRLLNDAGVPTPGWPS